MRRLILCALATAFAAQLASAQLVDEGRRREAFSRYRAGEDFMSSEQFERAVEEFSAAIKLDPLLTLAHYGLGQARMELKQYAEAIRAYLGCRSAFRTIGGLKLKDQIDSDRQRDEEIRELRDSIRRVQSGQVPGGVLKAVRLETRIQDLERAKQRGLEGYSTPAALSLALGSAYFRSGALENAEREYREAIRVNPRLGEAHNNLAVVCMMTDRLAEADAQVRAAEKSGFRVNPRFKEELRSASTRVKLN